MSAWVQELGGNRFIFVVWSGGESNHHPVWHFVAFIEIEMNLITKVNPEERFSNDNGTSFF